MFNILLLINLFISLIKLKNNIKEHKEHQIQEHTCKFK